MRKLLVFLLLLGAGLFLLYWLDQRALESVAEDDPTPPRPEVELDRGSQGFQPGGPSQLTIYDKETRRPAYNVKSEDTRTQGGQDILTGVVLELFDPEREGQVQLRVLAESARMSRLESGGGLQPRWEDRLELEGVHAELLAGLALAPMVFETASALVDLSDRASRRVSSEVAFSATAPELTLQGRGFEWALDRGELEIARGGRVELLRAGSAPATLTAENDGPIRVQRPSDGSGSVTLDAREGAVLEPGAENPGRLRAGHMTLRARRGAGAEVETQLALERLEAEEDVDWTSGEARFQGQRLVASFQADGRIDHARLDGKPRAELTMVLSSNVLPNTETPQERLVVLEGQDALDITWKDGGYQLHVESLPPRPGDPSPPSVPSVITRDFRLRSASSIDGWLSEDQRTATFEASGGVVVTSGAATLETASFRVQIQPDASGETILVGTASGGARLEGELPPGGDQATPRHFTLTSPEGLKIERSARGWRVIESTQVELSLAAPEALRARADRVFDFVVPQTDPKELSPEGMHFKAQGAVQIDFDGGRVGGEELDVLALYPVPHLVVRGTEESKAFLSVENGGASALEVELTGGTLEARGAVTGSGEFSGVEGQEPVRVDFTGDELTLDRSEGPELLPGERLRTLRVVVQGNVRGTVVTRDQTLVLRSTRFSAENRARLVQGTAKPVELGSLFIAEDAVHADFLAGDSDFTIDCQRFEIDRTASDLPSGFREFVASGDVRFKARFSGREEVDVTGEGEVLVLDSSRKGSLEAGPHGRVLLFGLIAENRTPFRLTAERIDFEISAQSEVNLLALRPELRMLGLRAHAEHFTVDDRDGAVLSGSVRTSGTTAAHVPFTLDADSVVLVGRRTPDPERETPAPPSGESRSEAVEDQLDSLHASGHVDFRLSEGLRARGERMIVQRATGIVRLEGRPASFDFGPARFETEWVEFDPVLQILVATGPGRLLESGSANRGVPSEKGSWSLDFLSASTLFELDSVVLVIQEPLFRNAQLDSVLRASWSILWLNREGFQDSERRNQLLDGLERTLDRFKAVPRGVGPLEKLTLLRSEELAGLLREMYFEGPVEVLTDDELVARADAMYLDVASQHGWLSRATINMGGDFLGQRREKLVVKADWLRLSSDASLRADRATVTSCDFDEAHVRIVTGNLKIKPSSGPGKEHYQLTLRDNRIEMYDKLRIPLPNIELATDDELDPLWPTLSLANSARFGTLFSFAFTRPADAVGRVFDRLARPASGDREKPPDDSTAAAPPRKPRSDVDAHYKIDGSYLGSRGALLDLGLEIEAKEDYWFDLYVGLALDSGEDRGFVRVEEDDRDVLRRWVRSRAFFDHGKSAWSFSYSEQSDPGVQSEFFENQFVRYERAENYVQWRRSSNENFAQGSLKLRVDDFRTEVEELPSLSAYRGRSPLLRLGSLALLHTGDIRAEYLRRRSGTLPQSPFETSPTFEDNAPFGTLDGLGEREVLRVDTTQELELPVPLGSAWKLTPFIKARGTAWSEGVEESDSPSRTLAEAGARLGTTLWKRTSGGKLHQLAPFVEYRSELERSDENGTPVVFDKVDRVLSGDFVSFGSRARFAADGQKSLLDVDAVASHASNRSDDAPDGWLPLEVFGRLLVEPLGHEFEIFHDGRYDLETNRTVYSLVSLGTHLGDEWGVQFSHQRGLDQDAQPLFEAATLSGLYRWTEKWEFEGRESFSLLDNQGLDSRFLLRRYGHDIVFELETSFREGEGSSFGISVKPRFGYRPPRVGYVPW